MLIAWFVIYNAAAHTPSETYLSVQVDGTNLTMRWDVALRDLHQGMGLDAARVPSIPAEELQQREEALALDVAAGFVVRVNSNVVELTVTDYTTLPLNDVEYARLIFAGAGTARRIESVEINAAAVFRVDTNMHGLLRVVQRLLRTGADPDLRDALNRTPREIAVMRGFVDVAAEFNPAIPGASMARFLREPR